MKTNVDEDHLSTGSESDHIINTVMDYKKSRFPYCIVWTPIPILTWIFPIIGHMGIALSNGVIRDFAGPYFVSEDDMAFGKPTKYWKLDCSKAKGSRAGWDSAVSEASDIYMGRIHNLFCDNCHSHVARALNIMEYNGTSWNMVRICFYMLFYGKYVNVWGFMKTWIPFFILVCAVTMCVMIIKFA